MRPAQRPLSHLTDGPCVPAPHGRSAAASAALRGGVGAPDSGRRAGRLWVVAARAVAPERHLPDDSGLRGHASRLPRCRSCHKGGPACTGPQMGAVGDVSASWRVVFECRPSVRPCRASCACASFARVGRCGEVLLMVLWTVFEVVTRSLPSWTSHDRTLDRKRRLACSRCHRAVTRSQAARATRHWNTRFSCIPEGLAWTPNARYGSRSLLDSTSASHSPAIPCSPPCWSSCQRATARS